MTENDAAEKKPLWLCIEEKILTIGTQALSGDGQEASIQRIAGQLDDAGYNVSGLAEHMLALRWAVGKAVEVGRPMMQDLNATIAAYSIDEVAEPYGATTALIDDLGKTWPALTKAKNRPDIIQLVETAKLNLFIAKAKEMPGDAGIRLLIGEKVADDVITGALDITAETLAGVHDAIAKEAAEKKRILTLLEAKKDKSDEEKVKHLFSNDVSEALIVSIAKIGQDVIDGAKAAMEAEMAEKQRLAEEAAAKKKAEAEGPALEDMTPEDMLAHIEAIREIQEFSDQEKEIRTMCEQSSIPKALVDIAVSDPAKFDELEKNAAG
jgi:hypothetical protein